MKYLITGGSGFIGSNICKKLAENKQNQLFILTRNINKTKKILKSIKTANIFYLDNITTITENFDIIINLAGAGIFDHRWSKKYKQILIDSRVNTTNSIYQYLKRTKHKVKLFITGSAVGIYGHNNNDIDENSPLANNFAASICKLWEQEAQKIESLGIRTCYLRLGVVIGNGGMLKKTIPSTKLGLGAYFASGEQKMPWVSINDVLAIINYLEVTDIDGIINVTAPEIISNKDFMQTLATILNRKILFNIPAKILNILFGQSAKEILLINQQILPNKLLSCGYQFKDNNLEIFLAELLAKKK